MSDEIGVPFHFVTNAGGKLISTGRTATNTMVTEVHNALFFSFMNASIFVICGTKQGCIQKSKHNY